MKGGGDYPVIGLVEVMWKAVVVILNLCFTTSITYCDSLHGLWAGCGYGTATVKVKLLRKFETLRETVIHEIFLDLQKAYDALYRSRCLEIL